MFKFNIRIDINTKSLKIDNKKEFVEITCSYWKNVLKYYLSEKTLLKVLVVLSELLENALLYNTGDDIYFEILIYKENCVIITNNEIDTLKFNYIYEYIKEIKDDKFSFKYYYNNEQLGLYTIVKIIEGDLSCYKVEDRLFMEVVVI